MDERPIGIFDSGVGGLTVLKVLQENLPNENFIYFADTLNFPYGEKNKEEIIELSKRNIEFLIKQNVKIIIIACGTATSQSLKEMKKLFNIPIIGIIEPTVDYVKNLNIKKVGVMATSGTIRSGAWEENLKEKINGIEVTNKACPLLANLVEEGEIESQKSLDAIHNYAKIFKERKVKDIILGCTHYPIYDEIIEKEFNNNVNLINTGTAVLEYLKKLLKENNLESKKRNTISKIIISKEEKEFKKKTEKILKTNNFTINYLKIS